MPNVFGILSKKLFGRATLSVDAVAANSVTNGNSGPAGLGGPEVWLYPNSEELDNQTLLKARQIEQPVFKIGRRVSGIVHYPHNNPPDLLIVDNPPYTLSRQQCEIEIKKGKVILRDLGSRHGTVLGDKRLRTDSRKPSSTVVPKGSHSLVLGSPQGPFRFRLEIS